MVVVVLVVVVVAVVVPVVLGVAYHPPVAIHHQPTDQPETATAGTHEQAAPIHADGLVVAEVATHAVHGTQRLGW